MNEWKARGLRYWQGRTSREQWISGSLAVMVLLAVLVFRVWLPAQRARERLQTRLPVLLQQLAQMQQDALQMDHLRHALARDPSGGDWSKQLTASAAAHGLTLQNMQSVDAQEASFSMDGVDFNRWLIWLASLQHDDHVFVSACQIVRQTNGVHVQATVRRGA